MSKLNLWRTICLVSVFCALAVVGWPAETYTILVSFGGFHGRSPDAAPVQGLNGNYYGTTRFGGTSRGGTIYEVTRQGRLKTLYNFQNNGYGGPVAGLVLATDGNFYGTTPYGGADLNVGTVFKITPDGTLTTLYSFCSQTNCTDGFNPFAKLVQATDGNFYGTTVNGGANGNGTVFKITPDGRLTTLYSFCSQTNCTDGAGTFAGLVQAIDGNFYGTTVGGGANSQGTVFKITPGGRLTTLYSFCSQTNCTDGTAPADLVQATNGNFYGITGWGDNSQGTVFKITARGRLTTLYSFCSQTNCTDGVYPTGLVQATDGNLYGTTWLGGANGFGTVFELTAGGQLTTLHSFCYLCTDGEGGVGLVQATNGNLYGTTDGGGAAGRGTIFRLTGLRPFVETLPTSGKVGTAVIILGNNLTGTTSVTFNGTSATFTVVSGTEITTTVPAGAMTGKVEVKTPTRTLISNVNFRVN
jgi:uncharacterized repeat protein (TIGR03803 family)